MAFFSPKTNGRQRTVDAWKGVDVDRLAIDKSGGTYICYDFETWTDLASAGSNGIATLVQATAGQALILDTGEFGVIQVDCNSTTDNQGATLIFPGSVVIPKADRLIVLEGRYRCKDIATGPQTFIGLVLSTLDTTPITADAPASGATDYVGLYTTGNTGVTGKVYFAAEDGGTQSLATTTVHTYLDGDTVTDGTEWVKFAIRIEGTRAIRLWKNGTEIAHDVAASAIPEDTALRLVLACLSATTTDPILEVDRVELASVPLVF